MQATAQCPKCSAPTTSELLECPRCGVVLSKAQTSRSASRNRSSDGPKAAAPARSGRGYFVIATSWLALGAYGALGDVLPGGWWASIVPAYLLYLCAEGIGFRPSGYGPVIGHAHSPPFLYPLGFALVYLLPASVFFVLGFWRRGQARRAASQ